MGTRKSIAYLYRDKREGLFSIENIFREISSSLADDFNIEEFFVEKSIPKAFNIAKVSAIRSDIVHVTGDVNYLAFGLAKKNSILTVHDLGYFENPIHGKINKLLYKTVWLDVPFRKVGHLTAISNFTADKLVHYFPFVARKLRVIHNPVSTIFKKRPTKVRGDVPTVLSIGTGLHKNIDRLFEAATKIKLHLAIIGYLNENQVAFLKKNNISFTVHFNLTPTEIVERYNEADILYFASLYEGFGLPIAEANTVGVPVVTSRVAAMPEIAGDSAYLVDPEDVSQIVKAIKTMLESNTLQQEMIEKGFLNAKRFELPTISRAYKTLYDEIK